LNIGDGTALASRESEETMLRLKRKQRQVLVDKVPDVANLVVGALFLGQFLSERPFSLMLALSGIAGWAVLIGLTLMAAGFEE
jgi:hypothetical protein